jgi:flagellar basal-body rod modification protein FlgD
MTTSPVTAGIYVAPNDRIANKTLDQQDFIKLLITQMSNQDPTKPQDTGQMLQQMSSLSMIQSMNQLLTDGQMTFAQSLLGKNVTVQMDDTTSDTGKVSQIRIIDGAPNLVVNGVNYALSALQAVLPDTPATTTTP